MLHLRQPQVSPSFVMQPSSTMEPTMTTTTPASLNESQRRIHQMLSSYISTIRRDDFLPRLNRILHSRVSSPMGSPIATADMQSYYSSRPELRKYTLGVEMDRDLEYTLIMKDGKSITDKDAIRSYFGVRENEKLTQRDLIDTEELLIRAANQSLLADALAALTGSEETLLPEALQPCPKKVKQKIGLILSGPILSMASAVEKCHFTLDLPRGGVESICVLAISVPVENRRLVLARAIMVANFVPGRKRQLQYAMQLVKAHHFPQSKPIRDAAISLARDQENLLLQSSIDENSAVKKGAKLAKFSFAFLR